MRLFLFLQKGYIHSLNNYAGVIRQNGKQTVLLITENVTIITQSQQRQLWLIKWATDELCAFLAYSRFLIYRNFRITILPSFCSVQIGVFVNIKQL